VPDDDRLKTERGDKVEEILKEEVQEKGNSLILTDKDLHCISRLIQSAMFAEGENILYGCRYCKYSVECGNSISKREGLYYTKLRKKLQKLTGVDLSPQELELEKKFYPASFQALYPKEYERLLQEQDICRNKDS